jgi:hypothetical protein
MKLRLADYSGGTAADFHGLPFYLAMKRGTTGTRVAIPPATAWKLASEIGDVNGWRLDVLKRGIK